MGEDIFDYPVLKKSKHSELVVSFKAMNTATVVVPNERYKKGFMSNGWDSHLSLDVWEDGLYVIPAIPCEPTEAELDDMEKEAFKITEVSDTMTGANDGSKNSFYDFPEWVTNIDTLAEYLQLDGYDFNVLKSLTLNLGERHAGTSKEREIKKRVHYAGMALEKFNRS